MDRVVFRQLGEALEMIGRLVCGRDIPEMATGRASLLLDLPRKTTGSFEAITEPFDSVTGGSLTASSRNKRK
jgi:hypothetical protein